MPVSLSVKLASMRPAEVRKRDFLEYVREGLRLALEWWVKERWPLRFGKQASNRFKYSRRTLKHLFRKAKRNAIPYTVEDLGGKKKMIRFDGMLPGQDPEPFEFTGELRRTATQGFTIKATATSSRQRAVLRLPFGHAIHPSKIGELTKLTAEERQIMRRIVVEHVARRLAQRKQAEAAIFIAA